MSDQITNKVYKVLEKYRDPLTGKNFHHSDSNINIIVKNGHLNVSMDIDPLQAKKYENIQENIQNDLKKIENALSTNFVLTSEKIPNFAVGIL